MTISPRLQEYLTSEGVPFDLVAHSRTATSSQTAHAAHVSGGALAKCVVVHHELGYVLAVVPSTHRVELGALQGLLNTRLGLATEEQIAELFGDCDIGAVPPVGAAYGMPAVVDESIGRAPDVYFEGGDHKTLVHVTGDAFRALMKGAPQARISRPAEF
jgi:Ala-tRNA(Pro) deacylase